MQPILDRSYSIERIANGTSGALVLIISLLSKFWIAHLPHPQLMVNRNSRMMKQGPSQKHPYCFRQSFLFLIFSPFQIVLHSSNSTILLP
ncbi:hypothetical protein ES332_A03G116400v1 [Gossypium tomentosum]|uniref:Uncharacterized protein n=1 Tax=Gossypium tomentosum TaxID=34277 RepID=A0A5D2R637_GOSTO|nr:hypothetical protein ES332_A03G116400v1 [Gossypium tomentosum]